MIATAASKALASKADRGSEADRLDRVFGPNSGRRYLGEADKQAAVRELRDRHGWSVRRIAERTGISKSAVQRYLATDAVPHGTPTHPGLEELNAARVRNGVEPYTEADYQQVTAEFDGLLRQLQEVDRPEVWAAAAEVTARHRAQIEAEHKRERLPSIAAATAKIERLADSLDAPADRVDERLTDGKDDERDPDAIRKAAEQLRLASETLAYEV